ncbi:hypothetical protein [Haloarcula onubensis]|uniref:Uncharacterized protein n=1 Tax=Haloarcula onubensis TaxID=2950539 RepID=A0ABU2FMI3_9EURY|nr:hypothetical protein [Halomicroarcula sp. S3CR25-11]MDS0281968.1 hypothetical protein [Halomicroarcula sp. S3CR25-11]
MTRETTADRKTLGTTLTALSSSANGLSSSVQELNRAIDDLQVSTAQWGENQRAASESLSRAADSLKPVSVGVTDAAASGGFAAADD